MKALCLESPKVWKQVDVPGPAAPAPGEALVRVHQVGICGTDISGYLGKMPFFSYPRIPGHELGVEVLEVGAGVTNVRPGDTCPSIASCAGKRRASWNSASIPSSRPKRRCSRSAASAWMPRSSSPTF